MREPLNSAQQLHRAGHGYADTVHNGDEHESEHHARDDGFQECGAQLSQECRNGSNSSSHSHSFIPQTLVCRLSIAGE